MSKILRAFAVLSFVAAAGLLLRWQVSQPPAPGGDSVFTALAGAFCLV